MSRFGTFRKAAALLIAFSCAASARAADAPEHKGPPPSKIPDDCKTAGFALGCQAWTFNHFTVMEAIEKTEEAGGNVIEFFPGQKLRKDQPAVTFSHNSPDAVIEQVKEQLAKHHVRAINYGVVGLPDNQEEIDKVFSFAKKMGLVAVTSEPDPKAMDKIEAAVKKYDIRLCIHDHPKREKDPSYKYWDPNYVLSLVKDRDPRMGACADTGHWVRSGIKPVDALKILEGRVMSSHLKDLNEFSPNGHDVPFGQGVSDVKGVLDELKRQGFDGNISIEYEYHQDNPLPEVKQCVENFKKIVAGEKVAGGEVKGEKSEK